jgi:hypothetical protein
MGVDACIYIKSKTDAPRLEEPLPEGFTIQTDGLGPPTSTHEVYTLSRYYGPGYERGPWPTLCAVLMTLMNSPDIESVWYFGDYSCEDDQTPITCDDLFEITRHFIANGERPYRGPWPSNPKDQRAEGSAESPLLGGSEKQ